MIQVLDPVLAATAQYQLAGSTKRASSVSTQRGPVVGMQDRRKLRVRCRCDLETHRAPRTRCCRRTDKSDKRSIGFRRCGAIVYRARQSQRCVFADRRRPLQMHCRCAAGTQGNDTSKQPPAPRDTERIAVRKRNWPSALSLAPHGCPNNRSVAACSPACLGNCDGPRVRSAASVGEG